MHWCSGSMISFSMAILVIVRNTKDTRIACILILACTLASYLSLDLVLDETGVQVDVELVVT